MKVKNKYLFKNIKHIKIFFFVYYLVVRLSCKILQKAMKKTKVLVGFISLG